MAKRTPMFHLMCKKSAEKAVFRRPGPLWQATQPVERKMRYARRAEGEIIPRALEQHRWNRRRTAEALRIGYRSLMYKMKNCDIRSGGGMRQGVAQ